MLWLSFVSPASDPACRFSSRAGALGECAMTSGPARKNRFFRVWRGRSAGRMGQTGRRLALPSVSDEVTEAGR